LKNGGGAAWVVHTTGGDAQAVEVHALRVNSGMLKGCAAHSGDVYSSVVIL
jgi:hypothetical protein